MVDPYNAVNVTGFFEEMGAQVQIRDLISARTPIVIDIRNDRKKGEVFDIRLREGTKLEVLQIKAKDKHLVLLAKGSNKEIHHFLCGHDERHWFVAATEAVSTVDAAKRSLKPNEVQEQEKRKKVKTKLKNKRKNAAFKRQGEWFFIPAPEGLNGLIHKNEPLRRGRSKPHMAEELIRVGGETVYVNRQYPNGLTPDEYEKVISAMPEKERSKWNNRFTIMTRGMTVYVRGKIRHPDHKTLVLKTWHRVVPSTEQGLEPGGAVAFLD